jgi:hypothetical protein
MTKPGCAFLENINMKTYSLILSLASTAFLFGCENNEGGEQAATTPAAAPEQVEQQNQVEETPKTVVDSVKDSVNKVISSEMVDSIKETSSAVVDSAKETANNAVQQANNAVQQAKDAADKALQQAKGLIAKIKTYIEEGDFDLAEKAVRQLESIKAMLPESIQKQISSLQAMLDGKKEAENIPATKELPTKMPGF